MNKAQSAIKRAMPSIENGVQATDKTIHQAAEIARTRGKLLLPSERAKQNKRLKRIMLTRISLAAASFMFVIGLLGSHKKHSGE